MTTCDGVFGGGGAIGVTHGIAEGCGESSGDGCSVTICPCTSISDKSTVPMLSLTSDGDRATLPILLRDNDPCVLRLWGLPLRFGRG